MVHRAALGERCESLPEIVSHKTPHICIDDLRQVVLAPLGLVQAVQDAEQQGGLVLEVVVNRPVGDSRGLGHIANGGAVKAALSKDLRRGVEDLGPAQGRDLFLKGIA